MESPDRIRAGVAVAALVVCAVGVGAEQVSGQPVPPAPTIDWSPERPAEGELFVLRVRPEDDDPVLVIVGDIAGESLHFTRSPDGTFTSLAVVPLGEQSEVRASLQMVYADGRQSPHRTNVVVTPGVYDHRELRVAPELGSPPDSAQRARRAAETAKARAVSELSHRTPRIWTSDVVLPRPNQVTSGFGDGRVFNGQVSSRHTGLDLRGAVGDTVVATTRGVVALIDTFELAGNIVYLNHGAGLISAYFHLSEQLVAEGDTVQAGTPVGLVGATGRVTGPHLHWVVRYGHESVDPRSLLAVSQELAP